MDAKRGLMRLSVIIVHWNTAPDLRECLVALQKYPWSGGETEIVVVDNASRDGAVAMLAAEFPEVRVIANAENLIYAAATNQALCFRGPMSRMNSGESRDRAHEMTPVTASPELEASTTTAGTK